MLTMSQINDIRDLSQKGYSISKISSLTGLDRKTVRKYLNQDDFSPQPPVAKRRTSIVTPYLDIIEEWLEEDQKHWSKQRHTAKRIHERLQTEYGFTGSYDSVQKFVKKIRTNIQSKGSQELIWEPVFAGDRHWMTCESFAFLIYFRKQLINFIPCLIPMRNNSRE